MLPMVNFCQNMVTMPLWMVLVENIIVLISFEKEELVCYIFVFLGKDTQESWAAAIQEKGCKTEGLMSIVRLMHYRLSGV